MKDFLSQLKEVHDILMKGDVLSTVDATVKIAQLVKQIESAETTFDYATAAKLTNLATLGVSQVFADKVREFVWSARYYHDKCSWYAVQRIDMDKLLTSREAEIELLKKLLMEKEA